MYLLILIVLLIIIVYYQESFTSKEEKSMALFNWFSTVRNPTYAQFRRDLNDKSNIVEYEDILTLKQNGNLSLNSIKKVI